MVSFYRQDMQKGCWWFYKT